MINKIKECEAIIVLASNGFSISEGYNIFNFDENDYTYLSYFIHKYRIRNIISGFFSNFSLEDQWMYNALIINKYNLSYIPSNSMKYLKEIINDTDYFILTSNTENTFSSTFDKDKIFLIEGSFNELICSKLCHKERYPSNQIIKKIYDSINNNNIDKSLIPHCPHCNALMKLNIADSNIFLQDQNTLKRFQDFLKKYQDKKVIFLELGVGGRNTLIKSPMMQIAIDNIHSTYISINLNDFFIPQALKPRAYLINKPIEIALKEISKELNLTNKE